MQHDERSGDVSERMKSAAEHAKEAAAKHKDELQEAAKKAEAHVQEDAAKAKEKLAQSLSAPRGKAG
jgi:hypothetical protein